MTNLPKSRQAEIVVQELETETLIYDLKTNKAFCLNETSALIWQLCDGTQNVTEITNLANLKANTELSEEVVWLALDQLKRDNLLENGHQFEINFNGLNRRQMIKKVGLASMIALPFISSLIAPSAAMAQSVLLAACVGCNSNSQCANNNCQNMVCSNGMNATLAPSTDLGGAAGTGFCSDPNAGNNACTTVRGNLCCSGRAVDNGTCMDSLPGPNFMTFSVRCACA